MKVTPGLRTKITVVFMKVVVELAFMYKICETYKKQFKTQKYFYENLLLLTRYLYRPLKDVTSHPKINLRIVFDRIESGLENY